MPGDLPPVGAREHEEMVTFSDPGGGEVADGFSFVTGTEWFEDNDDPTPLRRQRWVCVEDEVGVYFPTAPLLCDSCGGDGCDECNDTGENPLRGAGFVPFAADEIAEVLDAE